MKIPRIERTGSKVERARTNDKYDVITVQRRQVSLKLIETSELDRLSSDISSEGMQRSWLQNIDGDESFQNMAKTIPHHRPIRHPIHEL